MSNDSISAMLIANGFSIETVKKVLELREKHECLMEKTRNEIVLLQKEAILIGYNYGDTKIFRGFKTDVDPEKGTIEHHPIFTLKEIVK